MTTNLRLHTSRRNVAFCLAMTAVLGTGVAGTITSRPAASSTSVNQLRNPSFERNLSGWVSWSGRLQRIAATNAPDGHFVALVRQMSGPRYAVDSWTSRATVVDGKRAYTASALVAAGSASAVGKPVQLVLRETRPDGAFVQRWSSPVTPLTGSFRVVTATGRSIAKGDRLDVYAVQSHSIHGDALKIDRASLTYVTTTPIPAPVPNGSPTPATPPSTSTPTPAPTPAPATPATAPPVQPPVSPPTPATTATAAPPGTAAPSHSCTNPPFVTSDPFGGENNGGYYIYNNEWNAAYQSQLKQTLYACAYNNWYVVANMNNSSGDGAVKTYPDVQMNFPASPRISSFNSITSTFAETSPHVGIYEDAYDIWINGIASSGSTEVMIWNDNNHQVPGGTTYPPVTFSGQTFTPWKNGSYIAFVANTNFASGTMDLLPIFKWIIAAGWMPATSTLGSIQYGAELVSTNGTDQTFTFNNFSVTTS